MRLPEFLLALAPVVIVLVWARFRVAHLTPLFIALLAGAVSAVLALGLGLLIPAGVVRMPGLFSAVVRSFLIVGFVEELSRLSAVIGSARITNTHGQRETLALGAGVGVGFALFESLLVMGRGVGVLALRAVSAAPLHAALGALQGWICARKNDETTSRLSRRVVIAIVLSTTVHGTYDILLSAPRIDWIAFTLPAAAVVAALILDRTATS